MSILLGTVKILLINLFDKVSKCLNINLAVSLKIITICYLFITSNRHCEFSIYISFVTNVLK